MQEGGKAVLFDDPDGIASFQATVAPGSYQMSLVVNAYGPDNDGFWATVNDSGEVRVFTNTNYGMFTSANVLVFFTVAEDGKVDILFDADETKVMVDRVAIKQR